MHESSENKGVNSYFITHSFGIELTIKCDVYRKNTPVYTLFNLKEQIGSISWSTRF